MIIDIHAVFQKRGSFKEKNRMISEPKSSIFRKKAMQKYRQGQEKAILPRFVAPPVFLLLWILLIIFLSAGLLAWLGEIPVYVTGPGVLLDSTNSTTQGSDQVVAVILVPYTSSLHLHTGQPVRLQLGQADPQQTGTVEAIDTHILSADDVRKRYFIEVTEPSIAITVVLGAHLSARSSAGTAVSAQVQVGSRRLLSLFPGFDSIPFLRNI
jgi:hypothetical protein